MPLYKSHDPLHEHISHLSFRVNRVALCSYLYIHLPLAQSKRFFSSHLYLLLIVSLPQVSSVQSARLLD